MPSKIKKIFAREVLDSRADPTLEVRVILEDNTSAISQVPAGASKGKYEAWELRDKDLNRYKGKGVLKACENVNIKINSALAGLEIADQKKIDETLIKLDGTENKSNLGANAMIGVSLACARAASLSEGMPLYKYIRKIFNPGNENYSLPTPMFNVINSGKHAESSKTEIQEFMIVPNDKESFKKKLQMAVEIFYSLKNILKVIKGYSVAVGDEGGFAPALKQNEEALKLIEEAVEAVGYKLGKDVFFALDVAASEFYNSETKNYKIEGRELRFPELVNFYQNWFLKYPLISIEDGLAEDDWVGWRALTERLLIQNKNIMIVGDDLFTTNIERLKKGVETKIANTILIKPNQIGTLSETLNCIELAQKNKYKTIISHRSGETMDSFIVDLAVGAGAEYLKAGAPSRGERVVKYNRLLEIEEELQK